MQENSSQPAERLESGFSQFDFEPRIERAIKAAGWTDPRPIQAETIPAGLDGQDVLGLAQTGTGKTAAFVLPILDLLLEEPGSGPRALIVAPTRELAMQIHADIETLAQFTKIKAVTVFGGVAQGPQVTALRKNPDIIVACPGRLLDLHEQGHVMLGKVEVLVLDEADHMFDIGFLPSIQRIVKLLPKDRQNMLFSATMPKEIRSLANSLLFEPHVVELAHSKPLETIAHFVYTTPDAKKVDLLKHVLDEDDFTSAIVFSRTKFRAKRLADQLTRHGHKAVALQGNMTQAQRDKAMAGFRSARFDVLVATDVAARGIDVEGVSHVINFDIPQTPDVYTHRIGRTGRAGRSGKAYTFVAATDYSALKQIERKIGMPIERLESPIAAAVTQDQPLTLAMERRAVAGTRTDDDKETTTRPARRPSGGRRRGRGQSSGRARA